MKIRPLNTLISNSGYSNDSQNVQKATQEQAAAKVASDDAATVKVASGGSQAPDRAAQVASIREQVQNGSYKTDSTKVAEALVRDLF